MLSKQINVLGVHLLSLLIVSCIPQTHPERQIHIVSDKNPSQKPNNKQNTAMDTSFFKGLPQNCSITEDRPRCLVCNNQINEIKRCSQNITKHFDPNRFCQYNERHIKCFAPDENFAISVNLTLPAEKRFTNNIATLTETLVLIAESRISDPALKSEIVQLMRAIMTYSYLFINEPFQFKELATVLGLDGRINASLKNSQGIEQIFNQLFYEIQEKRKLGELDFQDSLKATKLIVLSLKDSPELGQIFDDLETTGMNLDDLKLTPEL